MQIRVLLFILVASGIQVEGSPQFGWFWPPPGFHHPIPDHFPGSSEEMDAEFEVMIEAKTESCDPQAGRVMCFNATALALCSPAGVQRIVPCRRPTPRCNANLNICVAVHNTSSTFTCPSESGYYPDPETCRGYYFCSNQKPYQYTCDWPQVYDPTKKSCAMQTMRNPCHRFSCRGKQGRYTPYPGEPNIYALCSGNAPSALFRCPQGQAMVESTQKCTIYCTSEGMMPSESCNGFFTCSRGMSGFRATPGTCPPGSWFDPKLNYCSVLEDQTKCPLAFNSTAQTTTMESSTMTENVTSTEEPMLRDPCPGKIYY